ncbi:MAG TPA: DUF4332 domain-containing protein [Proteiniclasticum sp.]|nr:DUF4332 domain-containing protein [Proteiniclasticum sp.]
MKYNLDLEKLSAKTYMSIIKSQNLLPSRKILLQNIEENFAFFERKEIQYVSQLRRSLSTPKKISSFAEESGISEEYLTILKREMNSLEQKPVLISSFPDIDLELVSRLDELGVRNSKDYWEQNLSESKELLCLCDLVRINGVGPIAAKVFYEAGYQSVSDVAEADAAVMLEKTSAVNESRQYFKAKLGLKDMQFCIDFASLLMKYCD